MELGVLGPLQVRQYGLPVTIPGAKPRTILTMLGLHSGSVVAADVLTELLWGDDPPRTATKALQTHISSLRHALGDGFVLTEGTGWRLNTAETDAARHQSLTKLGRDALGAGDTSAALIRFDEAAALWRGVPELPDSRRGMSEKTRWTEAHSALVEDRADALLATGRAAEIIGDLEAAVTEAPLRERRWGQLMLALYRAGRQGEALGTYRRARSLLADELGVDPGPELRRLEAAIVAQDAELDVPATQHVPSITRAVTFLLTDIEGSTAAWEADADAMAVALARHDELVEQVVTSRGGRLIKTRGEGDATFSVFDRPSAAASAAIELQDAIFHEPWALAEPMRVRIALHTGEAELRDGDYFGRAVNRAARLRSQACGGQILCSGATAELVIDSLSDDVVLVDLGMRQLKNLARPEHIFELRLQTDENLSPTADSPIERPGVPAVLTGSGPFVGRGRELAELLAAWQSTLTDGTRAVLIAGEPGVGKTRLAGEWSRQAYAQGAVVLYGRSDEDLRAPYQPFAEALRTLVPCIGSDRLRGTRGVEALLPLVPGLTDVLPDLAAPSHGDADTERYALFDAVVALLGLASVDVPIVLVLDDLHWAAKPTLLLLRHLLRFGEHARVQIIGTYRSTDLDRSHPLAAMLADLHRDGSANRIALGGLDEDDVSAYVAEAGYDDEELARALASVTGGNPFFLIEALRHVDESGGHWDPSTLPQGVREAVSRRLSRLPVETNKALAAAAVVGSQFALDLVEHVVGEDLVDAFDEARQAGILIEEPGGLYRFNHAIVRQSLLAELASVRRMRLHQRIATALETMPGADDELLADLAHHYFECAWAGNAVKAVEYCRRAGDQAMARLAYEGAADLYDHALHALDELDDELPDRDGQRVELLVARCEALLAAGDVSSAAGAVSQLQAGTGDSPRLAAWATCFDGQLSMLVDPERLDEIEVAVNAAAVTLAELGDAAGEAKAHTVRAGCLARLGRVAGCEVALDNALTAARQAGEHRLVNAVLAGAPLAALWGPNPVPRAGGRCLDVVRLLRITTDSPAVEATSTRCQAVLEAFRGRAAAARRMIDSARRTVTELGLRHALLEVEHFAGIVELVLDDATAAEEHLRLAYNGFRRMRLEADTAEVAALLARACLLLDRSVEADELCSESERLAGHALKAAIAWRTVRAQLLSRDGEHNEARQVAEEGVAIAERTDALVDHGDACLALATVSGAAGDVAGARAAAERAVGLYEQKGAVALAERARALVGNQALLSSATSAEPGIRDVGSDHLCVRIGNALTSAVDREAWDEAEALFAPVVIAESHRKIVGYTRTQVSPREWTDEMRRYHEVGIVRHRPTFLAVRGDRFALVQLTSATDDTTQGAPQDVFVQVVGLNEEGLVALQVSFDLDDMDAAIAELDAQHERFEALQQQSGTGISSNTACTRVSERATAAIEAEAWDDFEQLFAPNGTVESRRKLVGFERTAFTPYEVMHQTRCDLENGIMRAKHVIVATRGEHFALARVSLGTVDESHGAPQDEFLQVYGIDEDGRIALQIWFDLDDIDAALAEMDALQARFEAVQPPPLQTKHQWFQHLQSELEKQDGPSETGTESTSACVRAIRRLDDSAAREAWGELDQVFAPRISLESHRKIVGFTRTEVSPSEWASRAQSFFEIGVVQIHRETVATRGDRLALVRSTLGTADENPGAPRDELLHLFGLDARGRIGLQVSFDIEDIDIALAELDALHAQFERERPRASLENSATRADDELIARFGARHLGAIGELFTEDTRLDDRRLGVRRESNDRAAAVDNIRAIAALDAAVAKTTLALRGDLLCLSRLRFEDRATRPAAFCVEMLEITEVDRTGLMVAKVVFDLEDVDAAFAELDARYLAGEGAPHAQAWSTVMGAYAAFNRREIPPTTPDWVNVDKRHAAAAFAPGDMVRYIQAAWEDSPDTKIRIAAVHRLSDSGAVVTHFARGTSQDGFEAEWRDLHALMVAGDKICRSELFDASDLDAALAHFDELSQPVRRLENAASRATDRFQERFAARDWDAMAEAVTDDISFDDRRRVINADLQIGRESFIENFRIAADLGATQSPTAIATRGERVVLTRARFSLGGGASEEFGLDLLHVIEVDTDNRIAATVTFDPDDFDAAIAEVDKRYLAGESVGHAQAWSVIARNVAAFNRREPLITTQDWVTIDHRRATAFEPGDITPYIEATWDVAPDINLYIESVHRLSSSGALFSQVLQGTSQEGFDAEWRDVIILTVDGEQLSGLEVFDESDLDAAFARFDELSRPAQRLENTASRTYDRFHKCLAEGDLDAMAHMLSDDVCSEDRRRIVSSGIRHGRDAALEDARVIAGLGGENTATRVLATRGERLALRHSQYAIGHEQTDAYQVSLLEVIVVNTDGQIAAVVTFDPDDFEAALAELDSRYLAGEAAAHAHTWSVMTTAFAGLNRHELPTTAPNFVDIDHRRTANIDSGDMRALLRTTLEHTPVLSIYIEAVHRLTELGAVITQVTHGTSEDGFDAEWRIVEVLSIEGDLISRCEVFDEDDLESALARFEELSQSAPRLENAASRVARRFGVCFAARDWNAIAEILAENVFDDDRRRVVNAGTLRGRGDVIADASRIARVGAQTITAEVIATRGARLVLSRVRYSGGDGQQETFHVDALDIVEIDADEHLVAHVAFDPDDLDAAFEELDARYLAGEAAAYADTWSVITEGYAALNRHEAPLVTPDFVNVDHRPGVAFTSGELLRYLNASWEVSPDLKGHIETVHRLNKLGAVITHAAYGCSHEGFDAEWREVALFTVDGVVSRCEMYDESDLDAALAKFDELTQEAPPLENTASRVCAQLYAYLGARDWDAVADMLADDVCNDDRRRVVSSDIQRGRAAQIANLRAVVGVGVTNFSTAATATRGNRLALQRTRVSGADQPDPFKLEMLCVVEIDADNRIAAAVLFDPEDVDAAFAELDARYLAGEAAAYARTWSVVTGVYAALNRHELPAATPNWIDIDHRRLVTIEAGDMGASLHAIWDITSQATIHVEAVHQLSDIGTVVTHVASATSRDGFDAEWRDVCILTVEGDRIRLGEVFDESDLDAALARFDELSQQPPN
ncbi:BTAD domain-containing putative transcriptional regulator [Mycolicibacterium fortuitum]|uniref:BTAD domain-containing putative transcriptional regulator n=1 Tax=Mycolicibacterium fortuitum TaxID=1766 RepID=UPI0027E38738|nr:BTAD domain-containing putative transcriptional regulator [Mycolicibacterium fortuitum]